MNPIDDKDVAAQVQKLYELHQSGALSRSEFENAKRRVLGGEPPRMVAQPPPVVTYEKDENKPRAWWKVLLIAGGVILLLGLAGALNQDDDEDGDSRNTTSMVATREPTTASQVATEVADPTATAIPRTGIQTIFLSITTQDGWEAWGDGCVGGGDVAWATSSTGVVIAPSDASGTFRGRNLGAGRIDESGRCHWSARLTTRASDAYRIKIGDHDVVCHSNMMLPNDDGFYAAVTLEGNDVKCARVLDVSDSPETSTP